MFFGLFAGLIEAGLMDAQQELQVERSRLGPCVPRVQLVSLAKRRAKVNHRAALILTAIAAPLLMLLIGGWLFAAAFLGRHPKMVFVAACILAVIVPIVVFKILGW